MKGIAGFAWGLTRFLFKTIAVIALLVVLLILTSPMWIGPVGCGVANSLVPDKIGTEFNLADLKLNIYTGHFGIADLTVKNPDTGYDVEDAVKLGKLSVDLDLFSLFDDVVHIREINLDGLYVSYVKDAQSYYNFERIAANLSEEKLSPRDTSLIPLEVWDNPDLISMAKSLTLPELPSFESIFGAEDPEAKKVIIDKITISGVKIKYRKLPAIPLPAITITDIGKDSGGVEWRRGLYDIAQKALDASGVVGDELIDLAGNLLDAGNKALEVVRDIQDIDEAVQQLEAIGDSLKENVGAKAKKAGERVGAAAIQLLMDAGEDSFNLGAEGGEGVKEMGEALIDDGHKLLEKGHRELMKLFK